MWVKCGCAVTRLTCTPNVDKILNSSNNPGMKGFTFATARWQRRRQRQDGRSRPLGVSGGNVQHEAVGLPEQQRSRFNNQVSIPRSGCGRRAIQHERCAVLLFDVPPERHGAPTVLAVAKQLDGLTTADRENVQLAARNAVDCDNRQVNRLADYLEPVGDTTVTLTARSNINIMGD